jgi:mannosyl-oligosaccharide glucosidase
VFLLIGLDDYPRGYPPHEGELHVDLISWVAMMAKSLQEIAETLGKDSDVKMFKKHYKDMVASLEGMLFRKEFMSTIKMRAKIYICIIDLHWNDKVKAFCDLTMNGGKSESVVHLGYISLFPFILHLIPADSPKMEHILNLIRDERQLWTPYGLRSLSVSDKYFGSNENYWRGPIWINVNYLTVRALHHYKSVPGPYKEKAAEMYDELRDNLIKNTYKVGIFTL